MISEQENERLTRVGPGTPMGDLQRRYWHVVGGVDEMADRWTKRVRLLGEDLILFKDRSGKLGLIGEFCPHRRASLAYGIPQADGIRCPYHGWKFDATGACLEQPNEPDGSAFKDKVATAGYPVETLGGLVWAYLGPLPAPLLPRWDTLVRKDGTRLIEIRPDLTCNWLQAQENTADTTHTYYLHGHTMAQKGIKWESAAYYYRPIVSYDFSLCEWGITKTLFYGGDNPGEEIRPPLIFPNILRIPEGRNERQHWRVPIDDTSTRIIVMQFQPNDTGADAPPQAVVPMQYMPDDKGPDGEYALDNFNSQDRMAWETQGAIYDRTQEHLGVTDVGVVMLRKLLDEQIAIVEAGGEPMAILRDPAKNEIIEFSTHSLNRLEAVGSGAAKTS